MLKVAFIGWRGMVGSVLMERMREQGDFAGFEPLFASTSQVGQPGPDSLRVRTNGTNKVENEVIHDRLMKFCDMRLGAIVRDFNLRDLPRQDSTTDFYRRLAVYGHMGRTDMDVPWEDISRAKELKKDV